MERPKSVKLNKSVEYFFDYESMDDLLEEIDSIDHYTSRFFRRSIPIFLSQRTINLLNAVAWYYEARIERLRYNVRKQENVIDEDQKVIVDTFINQVKLDSYIVSYDRHKKQIKRLIKERNEWRNSAISRELIVKMLRDHNRNEITNMKLRHDQILAEISITKESVEYKLIELQEKHDKMAKRNLELLKLKKGAVEYLRFRRVAEKLDGFVSWIERLVDKLRRKDKTI